MCVREHSDKSKTLIDTDVSPLVRNINNCDLVCPLVTEKHHPMGGFLSRSRCVCVCCGGGGGGGGGGGEGMKY